MIGGNVQGVLQRSGQETFNAIGERIHAWEDVASLLGWLDLSAGDSKYTHDAKLQESTHIFVCDYQPIDRKADDKRMVINGLVFDVLLIDDPMELHRQLEIYLRFVG